MPDYEKMYHTLFNAMTDAMRIFEKAQQQAEEIYLTDSLRVLSTPLVLCDPASENASDGPPEPPKKCGQIHVS